MRKSLFFRNLLYSAGMVLLSFFVLGLVYAGFSYSYAIREQRETLEATAAVMAEITSVAGEQIELGDWSLALLETAISRATDTHVFLCDTGGIVVSCSDGLMQCDHLGAAVESEAQLSLEETGSFSGFTTLGGLYEKRCYVSAAEIRTVGGVRLGSVFVSGGAEDVGELWRSSSAAVLPAACIVLLLALPFSVLASRRETRPLQEMAAAARQFAKGDLSARVRSVDRGDEVGELNEAFNQMAEALEQSEKNRRDFIANVSHELKTPMTTISGFADGLLDGTIPMEQAERYLAIISDETKRLSRLVRQMLDVSRMQDTTGLRSGSFDVTETVRRALISLESAVTAKELRLRPELPEGALMVRGSGDAVSQVVHNILDNAVKFADRSSVLDVRLFKQAGKAYVSVTDRGQTIPEAELPAIFRRFHKSDLSRSVDRDGVGLGLYIVKVILDGMGEDIWVRSRDGETEFRFSLTIV